MKRKSDNPYKYIFSNHRIFAQLIKGFVHEDFVQHIDFNHIKPVDKSFVSEEFLKRESDIIYQMKFKDQDIYIYLLLEFQSTPDKSIPIRMWSYIAQFYDLILRNTQKGKLPNVFPALLYNGLEDWAVPDNIRDLIDNYIPERFIPSFEYFKIIIKDIPDEVLSKLHNLIAAMMLLEKKRDEEGLNKAILDVIEFIKNEDLLDIKMFMRWFSKMFENIATDKQIDNIKKTVEAKNMLTVLAKKIKEDGKKEGIKEGIKEGSHRKAIETALKMREEGMTLSIISKITGLSEAELKKILKD